MTDQVTIYDLELTAPEPLGSPRIATADADLRQVEIPCPSFNRFLYLTVGHAWHWWMKRGWSDQQWRDYVCRPELETWVLYQCGTPAGYFELERLPEETVRIKYFGLLPDFIGKKLGGRLLAQAVERAWALGAARIRVNTCTRDHPAALTNYLARGFRLVGERRETAPARPAGESPPLQERGP